MQLANIANKDRDIFLFLRNNNGSLDIQKVSNFFPYFYELDASGKYTSYKGDKLRKVVCSTPRDQRKAASQQAFESDIPLVKKFIIDKIDTIEPTCIKYAFIDIEIKCTELPNVQQAKFPVSCISIYNSLSNNIQTFWLPNFQSEYDMLEAFIAYMQEEKFDIWMSWNVSFDYNYLFNRIPDFAKRISPIQEERYINQDIKYPAGISIVDYLELFRKITLNKEFSYALDYISQKYLKDKEWEHTDFNTLNPIVKEKNINDVRRMVKLENLKKIIPYYDEIRRFTFTEWEDLTMNSRMIDMLLLKEAKVKNIVLPNKPEGKEEFEFEGAYRRCNIEDESGAIIKKFTGLHKSIGKVDLSSAYPMAIVNFNLDPANLRTESEDNATKIGDYYFVQDDKALLPTIVKKLIELKLKTKKELDSTKEGTVEHETAEMKYAAYKGIINSSYGTFGMKFFRLYEHPVASSTTYLIRDLLHTVEDTLIKSGTDVVYLDTDSVFVNNKEDITPHLNSLIRKWGIEKYGVKCDIEFAYEGYFKSLFIISPCHYIGIVQKPNGEIKKEMKGIEVRRKDSSVFIKDFQEKMLDKILADETEDNIQEWILSEKNRFKTLSIEEISFPARLNKEYEANIPIFARALKNTPILKKSIGDIFYYIYVKGAKRGENNMVLAFDKKCKDHITDIDWDMMIERNIYNKAMTVFEAMGWNVGELRNKIKGNNILF